VITQDYYDDGSGKAPRYYQLQAINKTIEAVSAGQNRVLLVMATGRENLHRLPDHLALMESEK
jgi:type I restriction enzyme R subunit